MNRIEMLCRVFRCISYRQIAGMPIKLAMNLLVKNEADIIEDNIRFHSQMGVDCFVVMDNGSTDNTREIIESLKLDFEIYVIERPVIDYQQSNWKSEMAFVARDSLGADWSIANDADEFWLADSGNLKSDLSRYGSVLHCPRYNMLLDKRFHESSYKYYHSNLQVNLPILNKLSNLVEDENLSISLGQINGKVLVNNHGLIRVKGGNHRAWHLREKFNRRKCNSINIFHYPIRSYQQFIENIQHRARLLENGVTKMGDHYRRWVRLYNEGRLEQEFERLVLSDEDVRVLSKFGVIVQNDAPSRYISTALNHGSHRVPIKTQVEMERIQSLSIQGN